LEACWANMVSGFECGPPSTEQFGP
jgi:hypothetical protein